MRSHRDRAGTKRLAKGNLWSLGVSVILKMPRVNATFECPLQSRSIRLGAAPLRARELPVDIRPFQKGDEAFQLRIYNAAAASLPKFKPASIVDIQRRTQAKDFDPTTRFYAVVRGEPVGYCSFQTNGRVAFPWFVPGQEVVAEPLFAHTIQAMKERGLLSAFSAYRQDWPAINDFFVQHGFALKREMVNFLMKLENMPTASSRMESLIQPLTAEDFPGIFALDPTVFRVKDPAALKTAIWDNPWIPRESLFVVRDKSNQTVAAAGGFITNASYADPRNLDSMMPCFRLGAFGTEGMTHKRVKGLFSFVTKPDRNVFSIGMDLLGCCAARLADEDEIVCYAAQAASDATALFTFYQRTFERQGSFPIYARELTT
jgi:hypothetical protein